MSRADDRERLLVRRLAAGEPIEWGSDPAGPALGGLRVVEALARRARAERRALAELAGDEPASAAPGAAPIAPGTRWGPLEIVEKIGEGSFGEVFRAHDPALAIDVALKLWFPRWSRGPDLEEFLAEARLLARLRHPHVLAVHGAAAHGGRVGMWTELLEGETLEDALAGRGRFGAREAGLIGAELCRALAAVHGAGLAHGDVKTRNVMRVEGGRVVLMDFGSATVVEPAARDAAEPLLTGTPLTLAPERWTGARPAPASDLYALGVLLYRLVTARYPVEAATLEELERRHREGARTPLRDHRPDLPAAFVGAVERSLERDPAARFGSAGAFEQALLAAVQDPPSAAEAGATRRSHHLPAPLTRFVGRARELAECRALLERTRLLTLTGVGGGGKTRLALRLAEQRLPDLAGGAWLVDLAPLDDPARVGGALAQVLEVREERGRDLLDGIAARIGEAPALVVLDNCEHVLPGARALAAALLPRCARLTVLATSREALGLAGEAVMAVPPLSLPAEGAGLAEAAAAEAVRLFVDGAALARPGFALDAANAKAVAEICRRLDGIPLAVELAASRVRLLSPEEILARLHDRFRLLGRGVPGAAAGRQTLLDTLAWSHDLLSEGERRLLRALAVFAGGWTLEAAQRVAAPDGDPFEVLEGLSGLVGKSLVVVDPVAPGGSRYRMLETVRQFALERLAAAGEEQAARDRHLEWAAARVEALAADLRGGPRFAGALAACDADHENLLAALAGCDRAARGAERALAIVAGIFPYWAHRTRFALGREHAARALARAAPGASPAVRAQATFAAANLEFYCGDLERSRAHAESSLEQFRALGLAEGVAWSLNAIANVDTDRGDLEAARARYRESLEVARAAGYRRGVATALNNLATLSIEAGDAAAALAGFVESAAINRELGRVAGLGLNQINAADACLRLGRAADAAAPLAESLRIVRDTGRRDYAGYALTVAACAAERGGDEPRAARWHAAAAAAREESRAGLHRAEREARDGAADRLRERLGAAAFAAAWEAGRASTLETAVGEALDWLEAGPGR